MEFVALDHLFPEWKAWDEFVQSVYNMALSLDSLASSHPVEVHVTHSDEINDVFDAISYAKGASIIRMLSQYIGLETFMKGMRLYLTRHAYGNAVSEDFWKALAEVSGKPLLEFMETWTKVIGFPILQLQGDDNTLTMTTRRFLASGANATGDSSTTKWPMPVTARVEGTDEVQGPWVIHGPEKDESEALLEQIKNWSAAGKWFKLNVDQFGFYRVNYTPEQWERLASGMDPVGGPLSATDRLGLISDSFAAGKAGYASIVDSLRLVQGFGDHDTAGTELHYVCLTLYVIMTVSNLLFHRVCCMARAFLEFGFGSNLMSIGSLLSAVSSLSTENVQETGGYSWMGCRALGIGSNRNVTGDCVENHGHCQ